MLRTPPSFLHTYIESSSWTLVRLLASAYRGHRLTLTNHVQATLSSSSLQTGSLRQARRVQELRLAPTDKHTLQELLPLYETLALPV